MISGISIILTEYVVFVGIKFVEHWDLGISMICDLSTAGVVKVYLPVVQDLFA